MSLKVKKLSQFKHMVDNVPNDCASGAALGIQEGLEIWKEKSEMIALKKTGDLRNAIFDAPIDIEHGDSWLDLTGTIETNAFASRPYKGQPFNYALYWHERYSDGLPARNPTTPGTVGNFLEVAGTANAKAMFRRLEVNIRASLKNRGWN